MKFLKDRDLGKFSVLPSYLGRTCLIVIFLGMVCNLSKGNSQIHKDSTSTDSSFVTTLQARGFSLIPTPQKVTLREKNVVIDESWSISTRIDQDDIAVRRLRKGARELHDLTFNKSGEKTILLLIQPGVVEGTDDPELNKQAYFLKVTPESVQITGNTATGLFYGVQSLLQLLRRNSAGDLELPQGEIWDWPTLQLRFVHWDTKHHQDRIKTLKRYLDWAAFFKVNMISFELWDKFNFPSHPQIGAPGAFTPQQLQEIVNYALERHIQVVPNIQAPSHFQWALKYPKYKNLRANGIDYQACLCNDKTYELIFDLYQDVIDATKGVDYFHVSTDELYYAGICNKCQRPYDDNSRSLAWAEFANKAHDWLTKRDRRMIAWVEWPLMAEDIKKLPPDIIDGVGRGKSFLKEEAKIGMHQLVYSSIQGSEYLFPNYFITKYGEGVENTLQRVSKNIQEAIENGANPIGTFAAAWDDSGLHNETFWLGWATVMQYSWSPEKPSINEHIASFMRTYYGPEIDDMVEIYKGLEQQARFFQSSWDEIVDEELKPEYDSYSGTDSFLRHSLTLPQPALPNLPGLSFSRVYNGKYEELVNRAEKMQENAEFLKYKLQDNEYKASRNHYNIEVLLSIANFTSHHNRMIVGMKQIEDLLASAYQAELSNNFRQAIEALIEAYRKGEAIIDDRKKTYKKLQNTWEKSRNPKGQTVNGNKFYHELDDVQDYFANRRADLSFMTDPEERIDLEDWLTKLKKRILKFAESHALQLVSLHSL